MAGCADKSASGAVASSDRTGANGPNTAVRSGENQNCPPGNAVANMPNNGGYVCGCLLPSALVLMADGTTKRLDAIEIGDYVAGFDPGGIPRDQIVTRIVRMRSNTLEVNHDLGTTICSVSHEFIAHDGTDLRAEEIVAGTHQLAAADGQAVSVTGVVGREDMIVMAVEVGPDANLVADGIRHHNKFIL